MQHEKMIYFLIQTAQNLLTLHKWDKWYLVHSAVSWWKPNIAKTSVNSSVILCILCPVRSVSVRFVILHIIAAYTSNLLFLVIRFF